MQKYKIIPSNQIEIPGCRRRYFAFSSFALAAALALCAPSPALSAASPANWPDLSTQTKAAPEKTAASDAALVIGIGDYTVVPDVEGAVQNAEDWWKYLRETRKIPRQNIGFLRDNEATAEQIRAEAERVASQAGAGGTIWFVFVGHGVASKNGEEGMLVGWDAQGNAQSLDARSVRQSEIEGIFQKSKAAHTVMLIDSCFSGQTPEGKPLAAGLQALVRTSQARAQNKIIRLTAGRSDQFAGPLPGAKRPAFSYLALGALRGWADADGNGQVTAQEVVDYANDVLLSLEKGRRQTPEIVAAAEGRSLSLSRGVSEKGPDIDAMVIAMKSSHQAPPEVTTTSAASVPTTPENNTVIQNNGSSGAANITADNGHNGNEANNSSSLPEMVFIPGGTFGHEYFLDDAPTVFSARPFWVSKTPVTVDQFSQCVAQGACPKANFKASDDMEGCNYGISDRGSHPMNCVDWYAARAYCQWAGGGHLPTLDEWMFAAIGGPNGVQQVMRYPWGNGRANNTLMNFGQKRGTTTPVGKYSPAGDSPLGVQDMCGNVWEWTSTQGGWGYIIKGGAYNSGGMKADALYMTSSAPSKVRADYGFRCAWEAGAEY